jgi:hypothetical protein
LARIVRTLGGGCSHHAERYHHYQHDRADSHKPLIHHISPFSTAVYP